MLSLVSKESKAITEITPRPRALIIDMISMANKA